MADLNETDIYIEKNPLWSPIFKRVVAVFRKFDFEEKVKWGIPVFCIGNKNITGIAGFKNHCAIWFYNGSMMTDPAKVLVSAQKDKEYALKQWRFYREEDLNEKILESYIQETIDILKNGNPEPRKTKIVLIPEELKAQTDRDANLKTALESLTPGVQKEFFEYIHEAKQTTTKEKRVQKIIPLIMQKQGLYEKYKK